MATLEPLLSVLVKLTVDPPKAAFRVTAPLVLTDALPVVVMDLPCV